MEKENTLNHLFKLDNKVNDTYEDSFEILTLYRSIYIIKRKFEIYKIQIKQIYNKYNINEFNNNIGINFYVINTDNFYLIAKEIFNIINCFIIQIHNPRDIFINLFLTDEKKKEMNNIIHKIQNFLFQNNNIQKYNEIFFTKKIKPLLLIKEKENDIEEIFKPIVEYDIDGNIIKTTEQLIKENKKINSNDILNELNSINDKEDLIKKEYLPQNNNLYIETFSLILADFLQNFSIYGIIEINDDLSNELNNLFNKEILEKINLFEQKGKEKELVKKINISKEKEFEKCKKQKQIIEKNIQLYEKILLEKKANHENGIIIEDMLEKLLTKKVWLSHKIQLLNKSKIIINESSRIDKKNESNKNFLNVEISENNIQNLQNSLSNLNYYNNSINKIKLIKEINHANNNTITQSISNITSNNISIKTDSISSTKEKIRLKSLKEIFDFYSNKHNYIRLGNGLFSSIDEKKNLINLSEFSKFCNEFSISISRQKLVEIYKKNSSNLSTMTFKEFLITIENLSFAYHENKKETCLKRIKQNKEKLNLIEIQENERIEEEKSINLFKERITGNKPKKSLEKFQFIYLTRKKKIEDDISSEKYKYDKLVKKSYIEIIESFYEFLGLYQKSIYRKKMIGFNIPFYNPNKNNNMKKNVLTKNKSMETLSLQTIESMKREKELLSLSKQKLQKDLLYNKKLKLFEKNNKKLELNLIKKQRDNNYVNIKKDKDLENLQKEIENKNKISWQKLDELNIDEIDMNDKEKEIFDNSYNSDDEELLSHISSNKMNNRNEKLEKNNSNIRKNYSSINIFPNINKLPPIVEKK